MIARTTGAKAPVWEVITNMYKCFWCNTIIENPTKSQKDHFKLSKHMYCSKECSTMYRKKISSITMSNTNKKYASNRMKINNPMNSPIIRKKVSETLKNIGHKPIIQGGNGRGLTIPQAILLNKLISLGILCVAEQPICTKTKRHQGYPPCYKVDIAILNKMIAIEIDGVSHNTITRQQLDIKKDQFLKSIGWTIIRFKNLQVMNNLDNCLQIIYKSIL